MKKFILIFLIGFLSCNDPKDKKLMPDQKAFEQVIEGKATHLYYLNNSSGIKAAITNYGGRLVSLIVPDKNEKPTGIVVGFDSVNLYKFSSEPYFGATIGRYGNRIAGGKFVLNGKEFCLSINNGPNTLHGGKNGFQYKVWDGKQINDSTLELSYLSRNGEEGFPGNLLVKVIYSITGENSLKCEYEATTDKETVVNLTNHAFFNLNGEGSGTINNHLLQINADHYTPIDSTLIPNGNIKLVSGTPFDFRQPQKIGTKINENNIQLKYAKGYDHNFVLNGQNMKYAASVTGDKSGIIMQIFTDEPGLQFYSGNFMFGKNKLRKGMDDQRTAFCLETQHFPDSPNEPMFPSTVLRPGEEYYTVSIYKFSVVQ